MERFDSSFKYVDWLGELWWHPPCGAPFAANPWQLVRPGGWRGRHKGVWIGRLVHVPVPDASQTQQLSQLINSRCDCALPNPRYQLVHVPTAHPALDHEFRSFLIGTGAGSFFPSFIIYI